MISQPQPDPARLKAAREHFTRFLMTYKFGMDEVMTKINILRDEFAYVHDYNPIEHVSSRLKSPRGIIEKAHRKGCAINLDAVRETIRDIAGVRITCSFLSDIYTVRDMLVGQQDLTVLAERDYIASPKANGYKSLHLIVEVPVFMSDRVEHIPVEVQIRTIAMDFWASLEHKIYYKYNKAVPSTLVAELHQAAQVANRLDEKMEQLHEEMRTIRNGDNDDRDLNDLEALAQTVPSWDLVEAFLQDS